MNHGFQAPSYLNSRYLEVDYLIESNKFKGGDSRSENEYDEVSGDEDDEE